jgi:hypothetical protein
MMPVVRSTLGVEEREQLNVEVFFMHGGRYQSQLLSLGLEQPRRVEQFLSEVALSRHVGVIRFQLDDAALVDIVCDTTDIRRDYPRRAARLASWSRLPARDCNSAVPISVLCDRR